MTVEEPSAPAAVAKDVASRGAPLQSPARGEPHSPTFAFHRRDPRGLAFDVAEG